MRLGFKPAYFSVSMLALTLMVAYPLSSLWIIAQPIVGG
jgi:hypothetical protein